ncbi:MAG: hypothetical protein K0R08_767 [Solimicrobium sp.]|jgi:hypothetical protein|nr:hypothetical protein [Solimicrobium sp.]
MSDEQIYKELRKYRLLEKDIASDGAGVNYLAELGIGRAKTNKQIREEKLTISMAIQQRKIALEQDKKQYGRLNMLSWRGWRTDLIPYVVDGSITRKQATSDRKVQNVLNNRVLRSYVDLGELTIDEATNLPSWGRQFLENPKFYKLIIQDRTLTVKSRFIVVSMRDIEDKYRSNARLNVLLSYQGKVPKGEWFYDELPELQKKLQASFNEEVFSLIQEGTKKSTSTPHDIYLG